MKIISRIVFSTFVFLSCAGLLQAQTVTFKPVARFNYPGAASSAASGINDAGAVVGYFLVPGAGYANGFERYPDGTFTAPIIYPGSTVYQTIPTAIDNNGTIAGWYNTEPGSTHGFFYKEGVFTSFDYPGANYTTITGINDAGDFVGSYALADGMRHSYTSIGGQLADVVVPGSTYVEVYDINNHGSIVGWYSTTNHTSGFLLEADDRVQQFRVPAFPSTLLLGTNDGRERVGQALNFAASAGLYILGSHSYFTYSFPDLSYNMFTGINQRGVICGSGYDAPSSTNYGYLVRRVKTGE